MTFPVSGVPDETGDPGLVITPERGAVPVTDLLDPDTLAAGPSPSACEAVHIDPEQLWALDYGANWSLHDQNVVLAHAGRVPMEARLTTAEQLIVFPKALRRGLGYAALTTSPAPVEPAPTPDPAPAPGPEPAPLPAAVWADDEGGWWADGHVDPAAMVLGVVIAAFVEYGTEAADVLAGRADGPGLTWTERTTAVRVGVGLLADRVEHLWCQPTGLDDVRVQCDRGDVGALPYTVLGPL